MYHIHSNFEGIIFMEFKASRKDFCGLIFADNQVEYIVSLSHYFSRIKILCSARLQRNLQNLCPLKITAYMVHSLDTR